MNNFPMNQEIRHENITLSEIQISKWIEIYNATIASPIKSNEEVLIRVLYIFSKIYPHIDFTKYKLEVDILQNGTIYSVLCVIPTVREILSKTEGIVKCTSTAGGEGPEILFDKKTGKILDWTPDETARGQRLIQKAKDLQIKRQCTLQ